MPNHDASTAPGTAALGCGGAVGGGHSDQVLEFNGADLRRQPTACLPLATDGRSHSLIISGRQTDPAVSGCGGDLVEGGDRCAACPSRPTPDDLPVDHPRTMTNSGEEDA